MGKKEKMYSEFLEVSRQTGVPVKKVLDIFWHLSRGGVVGNNELVQKVGVSRNALNQVKKALSVYLNPPTGETSLREGVAESLGELYGDSYMIEESLLKTLVESDLYRQSVEILTRYKDKRPAPKRDYEQFTAAIETTAKRAVLLDFLGDVRSKRVLFLGDDDFTSVVTANIKSAQEVAVLDIDGRIIDNIGSISEELDLGIRRVRHDLRKPITADLRGRFDVVFTDPPYTLEGIRLFVSRGLEAIDKLNQTARVYVCYGNSDRAKERFLPIQEVLTDAGLMLRWVLDRFNRYHGAESIGSASSLFVTEVTPKTKPLIRGNYDKPIYTNN
ncbi:TPA: putative methyltransferase [bacterium]|nr:putative methyltransferase [bacterium]